MYGTLFAAREVEGKIEFTTAMEGSGVIGCSAIGVKVRLAFVRGLIPKSAPGSFGSSSGIGSGRVGGDTDFLDLLNFNFGGANSLGDD
jgi:hypothetical protein